MTMAVMGDNGNDLHHGNDSVVLRIHADSSSSSEDERAIVKQQQQQKKKNNIPNGRSLKEQQKSKKKKDPTSIAEDEASEPSGSSLERNGSYFFGDDHLLVPPKGSSSTQRNAAAGGPTGGGDVDPPTKLIGSFLQRQKESGTFALDPTMDDVTFWAGSNRTTPDVSSQASPTISASQSWKNLPKPSSQDDTGLRSRRASFQEQQQQQNEDSAILKAPSRISSTKNYARASSKSRLVERPPVSSEQVKKSALLIRASQQQQQSSPQRSGLLGARNKAEVQDEDDPLDVPHRFSRSKWDFWAALQLAALVIIVAGLVCATNIPFLVHRKALGLDLWRWAVLALVVMSGRLLSGWIIHVLVFFIERNFLLRKRVLYFVYGLHKGVQNCLWFGIILLAWRLIFDPNLPQPIRRERKMLGIVTKVLVCLLVAASLWLLKILLVKVLALSFHVNTYFDRIQDSLFSQYILETLSGPPLLEQQALIEDEKKVVQEMAGMLKKNNNNNVLPSVAVAAAAAEDRPNKAQQSGILRKSGMITTNTGKSGMITGSPATKSQMLKRSNNEQQQQQIHDENAISIDDLQRLNQRNVSAWNMKRLIRLVKHSRLTTLAQSIEAGDLGDEDQEIQSEWQAKVGAKHIFNNVARPKSKYLTLSDFMRFLREEEAVKAFGLFDGALDSGMISKHSLINWVVNVYRERRALMFTLNDTKTAVNKLHKIIDVIMSVIIFVIWLLILEIASTHLLVLISSQLVLVAFVFGNTCKTVFEAIIFLFAMHPFDVGDRCVVDGVQMVVEEMNILTTVFLRYDNEKIYYPNTVLATKPISNFYRSPDMGDAIDFSIHIATPREKIEALKEKIAAYIDSHLHHWYVTHSVVMKEIEDMNRIRMAIWLQHTMNHQDAGEKWIRRSDLLFYLKDVFQELGIDYRMLPQEVHVRKI